MGRLVRQCHDVFYKGVNGRVTCLVYVSNFEALRREVIRPIILEFLRQKTEIIECRVGI